MIEDLITYLLAGIMGISLGLFGGGGSVLTVPILVYVAGINPLIATAYSLFVVGVSSFIGGFRRALQKEIAYREGIVFAIPSILAVYATRRFIIPAIPVELFTINSYVITRDMALMVLFSVMMVLASLRMMKKEVDRGETIARLNYPLLILEGFVVGVLTGLVGAGGGFLIVPVLVLMVGLSMKRAVATSLLIIALKSLLGFLGDIGSGQTIDWTFLLFFSISASIGVLIGFGIEKRLKSSALQKAFAWFILAMAAFILVKETMLR